MDVEEFMKKQSMMAVKISSLLIFAVLVGCDAANNAEEAVKRELDQLAQVGNLAGDSALAISDQVKREGKEFELTTAQEAGTAEGLAIDHAVGNIELIAVPGNEIKVKPPCGLTKASSRMTTFVPRLRSRPLLLLRSRTTSWN